MIKSETFIKDNHSISQFIFTTKRVPFSINDVIIISFFAFISVLQYKDYIGNKEIKFANFFDRVKYTSRRCEIIIKLYDMNASNPHISLNSFYSLKLTFNKDANICKQLIANHNKFSSGFNVAALKDKNLLIKEICINHKDV